MASRWWWLYTAPFKTNCSKVIIESTYKDLPSFLRSNELKFLELINSHSCLIPCWRAYEKMHFNWSIRGLDNPSSGWSADMFVQNMGYWLDHWSQLLILKICTSRTDWSANWPTTTLVCHPIAAVRPYVLPQWRENEAVNNLRHHKNCTVHCTRTTKNI